MPRDTTHAYELVSEKVTSADLSSLVRTYAAGAQIEQNLRPEVALASALKQFRQEGRGPSKLED